MILKKQDIVKALGEHYTYPLLESFTDWRVWSYEFDVQEPYDPNWEPMLRIVRDKGIVELYGLIRDETPFSVEQSHATFEDFQRETGVVVVETKATTGKRLSRVFRPSRWFQVFTDLTHESLLVDEVLWDGMNLISKSAIRRVGGDASWGRVELTYLTEQGQAKGHAFVVEDDDPRLNGADLGIPADSWKREIKFVKGQYLDVRPVKAHEHWMADIQSLINHLHELFDNETLVRMLERTTQEYLEAMDSGELDARLRSMLKDEDNEQQDFPLFQFLAAGGELSWSPTMVRCAARQWHKRLVNKAHAGHRLPIEGGLRLYIAAAHTGNIRLLQGYASVDWKRATLYVSDHDWPLAVDSLGGCDQDDAVNCVTDGRGILMSRNPNARGEFLVLKLANPKAVADAGVSFPVIPWERLDNITKPAFRKYGTLGQIDRTWKADSYMAYTLELIGVVASRQGALGRHVNTLQACTLTDGEEPLIQPATMEAVIDASVKELTVDLTPVKAWDTEQQMRLAFKPLCRDTARRLRREDYTPAEDHWLDRLEDQVAEHIDWFEEEAEARANRACPPLEVFRHADMERAERFRRIYGGALRSSERARQHDMADHEHAARVCEALVAETPREHRHPLALGLLALGALSRGSDAAAWQQGGITTLTIEALESKGVFIQRCDLLTANKMRATVGGVWYYLLGRSYPSMSDVPKAQRAAMKKRVAARASGLEGLLLHFVRETGEVSLGEKFLGTMGKYDILDGSYIVQAVKPHDGNLYLALSAPL